ncbi:MAG: hypothetical protein K1X35_11720 [Caulobacteraceae bacterium]|nr:hypothetical protein [Caulobacteraceae bacterium]
MTETANRPLPHEAQYAAADHGKVPAFIVYALYIAGVFSAHLLSPIGVIVAYVTRAEASTWVRTHLDSQIKMFWTVFWWIVGLGALGVVLTPLLVGIPILIVAVILAFILTIWFGVKSVMGLVKLINGRPV